MVGVFLAKDSKTQEINKVWRLKYQGVTEVTEVTEVKSWLRRGDVGGCLVSEECRRMQGLAVSLFGSTRDW